MTTSEDNSLLHDLPKQRHRKRGVDKYLALIAVPVLWATFPPVTKLVLGDKHSTPILVTSLLSHAFGTLSLCLLWAVRSRPDMCTPRVAIASAELGAYLFMGQWLQAAGLAGLAGLAGVSATTSAVLVQSSVVLSPFVRRMPSPASPHASAVSHVSKAAAPMRHLPNLLSILGIAIILFYRPDGTSSSIDPACVACSLLSALFYALHTIRTSAYSDVDATAQALGQVSVSMFLVVFACCSSALSSLQYGSSPVVDWVVGKDVGSAHGNAVVESVAILNGDEEEYMCRLLCASVWSGACILAATTWCMSYAQRDFPISVAMVTYAMEPILSAVFSFVFIGEELTQPVVLGGVCIIGANLLQVACE